MDFLWDHADRVRRSLRCRRGQSEALGFILVFGMVLLGTIVVVGLGASAVSDTETELADERAEQALTQFDSQAALVALGESNSQRVDVPTQNGEEFRVEADTGWLRVSVENRSSGNSVTVTNTTLGGVTYHNDGTRLAYQGGGVFRSTDGGGQMLSPPEFHHRGGTLTLPIVNVTGGPGLGSNPTLRHENVNRTFPNETLSTADVAFTNPLTNHEVEVTVQSEYYEGWGNYFEERTDGEVEFDHDAETATLLLRTPAGERTLENAMQATASDGTLELRGGGGDPTETDSYNSSNGSYAATKSTSGNLTFGGTVDIGSNVVVNGSVTADDEIEIQSEVTGRVEAGSLVNIRSGNAEVDGDVRTGGDLECSGNPTVNGDIYHTDANTCNKLSSTKEPQDIAVDGVDPIDTFVNNTVEEVVSSGDSLNVTANVTAGDYYTDRLELESETLTLKPGGDRIRIVVNKSVQINSSSQIDIQEEGTVELYVRSNDTVTVGGDEFHVHVDDSTVDTEGGWENSTQVWLYGPGDMKTEVAGGSTFEGVMYAPGTDSNVTVDGSVIFGGIVAGYIAVTSGGGSAVHFDQALESEQAVPESASIATINYLHVTVNEISARRT